MSVSAAKNTVEVRYFGEKHFRAIIAPKDCYMYSAERPSLHLGAHKKAFEKAQVVKYILKTFLNGMKLLKLSQCLLL